MKSRDPMNSQMIKESFKLTIIRDLEQLKLFSTQNCVGRKNKDLPIFATNLLKSATPILRLTCIIISYWQEEALSSLGSMKGLTTRLRIWQ